MRSSYPAEPIGWREKIARMQQIQKEYEEFTRAPKYSLDSEELFCVCRKPDGGELMVACDGCDEWFHFKCMGINKRCKDLVKSYYCRFCDELFHKGNSVWKRKCKLEDCYRPIESASQFCCEAHGKKYWATVLNMLGGSDGVAEVRREEVENLIQSVATKEELWDIGTSLPVFDKGDLLITPDQSREIDSNEEIIEVLKKNLELYRLKSNYIHKIKGIIAQLNDLLTNHLNPDEQQGKSEPEQPEKKRKKTKNRQKAKKFRIDICGFDERLLLNEKQWLEFTTSREFLETMDFPDNISDLSDSKKSLIFNDYKNLKQVENGNNELPSNGNSILNKLCICDKKKCHLHSGWFVIVANGIELKINEQSSEIENKTFDTEKLKEFIQIKNWKMYCNNRV